VQIGRAGWMVGILHEQSYRRRGQPTPSFRCAVQGGHAALRCANHAESPPVPPSCADDLPTIDDLCSVLCLLGGRMDGTDLSCRRRKGGLAPLETPPSPVGVSPAGSNNLTPPLRSGCLQRETTTSRVRSGRGDSSGKHTPHAPPRSEASTGGALTRGNALSDQQGLGRTTRWDGNAQASPSGRGGVAAFNAWERRRSYGLHRHHSTPSA